MKYLIVIIALMLNACNSNTEGEIDPNFILKKDSDLYGTWKYEPECDILMGCSEDPYFLVLGPDSSFFINTISQRDSKLTRMMFFKINFKVGEEDRLEIDPNYYRIKNNFQFGAFPEQPTVNTNLFGYDSLVVLSYSNVDSILRMAELADSLGIDTRASDGPVKRVVYDLLESKIQENNATRILTFIESGCHEEYPNAIDYNDFCSTLDFVKQVDFDMTTLNNLTPDIISSSKNWRLVFNKYSDYYPKDSNGIYIEY